MAKGGSTIRISNKSHKNASLFDFEPLVNSQRIGSIWCHVVYPTGKPEDSRSCVANGSQ